MSALETVKELGRMATAATLSKDVIDLFEKKVALLTDQITALETENTDLKEKVQQLEKELAQLQPQTDGIDEVAKEILKFLFNRGQDTALEYVAAQVGISTGKVLYYQDLLQKADFAAPCGMMIVGETLGAMTILPKGREYVVKEGLV